jgi:hypothetical protein
LYHSTEAQYFEDILYEGNIVYNARFVPERKNIAFANFMSSDVVFPSERLVWNYRNSPIIFGVSTKILSRQPFVVCDDMYMGMCMRYSKHIVTDSDSIPKEPGTKMPDTKIITDHINKRASIEAIKSISHFKLMEYKYDKLKLLTEIINEKEYKDKPIDYEKTEYEFWKNATEDEMREIYLQDTLSDQSMYFGRTHEIIIDGGLPKKYWKFILVPDFLRWLVKRLLHLIPPHVQIRYYSDEQYWDYKTLLKP